MRITLFVARRLGRLVLTVLLIATVVFFVLRVIPGDPAANIAGLDTADADLAAMRARLGLDRPLIVQYLDWLFDSLRLDFGTSYFSDQPAMGMILQRFPLTLIIAGLGFVFSLVVAVPLGVVSAVRQWSAVDYLGMVYSQLGMAIPGFWLGIMLLIVFAVRLPWFPLFGADSARHLVLPAVALGVGQSALLTRYVRQAVLDELDKPYITTARAMGLPSRSILYRHALRNALLPIITIAGIQLGAMLGGAIIIEQVFSIPGLGRVLLSAIRQRDFAVIQSGVVVVAVTYSVVNFIADLLYAVANPRIRVA